jgi:hypothetical protein
MRVNKEKTVYCCFLKRCHGKRDITTLLFPSKVRLAVFVIPFA